MAKKPIVADPQDDIEPAMLTADERSDVEKEVAAELEAEAKAKAKTALKAKLKAEAKAAKGEAGDTDTVTIDLAPYGGTRILIDNVAYLQGMTYTVPVGRAQVIREMMQATWNHQAEVDGKPDSFYRKAHNTRFSLATGAVTNAPLMKA